MTADTETCCPKFDPDPWDEKQITWENEKFVKDRVRSFFHIPLNFGSVMKRSMSRIEAANAKPEQVIVLADENSLWGADVYISVASDVPDATMATISGSFRCKVFEGPFKNIGNWIKEMTGYIDSQGDTLEKLLFYYTTCPKCAKKYGKNYVVLLAQVA